MLRKLLLIMIGAVVQKRAALIFAVLFLLIGIGFNLPCPAQELKSTISSGGTVQPGFQDIKGEPVIGESNGLQIGGIYVLGGGAGIKIGTAATGTVPLYIARSGSDILITWDAQVTNPDIYVLTGDGSGKYTADTGWALALSGGVLKNPNGMGAWSITGQQLKHTGEVGGGKTEAYYKGLQAGVPATDPNKDNTQISNLAAAQAVGKIIVNVYGGGRVFVSAPFVTDSLNNILGTNFTTNDQACIWDNSLGKFTSFQTFGGGNWPAGINAEISHGYWLDITGTGPGVLKPITVIGTISLNPVSTQIYTGWDMVGNPMPKQIADTGFVAGKVAPNDQIWIWDNQQHKFTGTMSYTTAWAPAALLLPGLGYRYNHLGTGFTWVVGN